MLGCFHVADDLDAAGAQLFHELLHILQFAGVWGGDFGDADQVPDVVPAADQAEHERVYLSFAKCGLDHGVL